MCQQFLVALVAFLRARQSFMDALSTAWDAAREYCASLGYGDVVFFTLGLSLVHTIAFYSLNFLLYLVYHFDLLSQYRIR